MSEEFPDEPPEVDQFHLDRPLLDDVEVVYVAADLFWVPNLETPETMLVQPELGTVAVLTV